MRRRTVIQSSALLALGTLSAFGLSSCQNASTSQSGNPSKSTATSQKPLQVALVPWIGWGQAQIAQVKGFFETEGIAVEQTVFQTVSEVNTAFVAKKMDLAWLVAADLIVLSAQAQNLKFIWTSDYSGDVDSVVGRPIAGAEEAKTRKFAREDVPYEIVFLGKYLESLGLTEKDVQILPLSTPDGTTALIAGNVDAVATYEPFLSNALKENPETQVLFSPKGTNIIVNGLAGHGDLLKERREDVLAYLRALNRAVEFWKTNPEEANEIVAKWVGITSQEVAALLPKIDLFDLKANQSIAFGANSPLKVAKSIDVAAPILVGAGKISQAAAGDRFVDPSFVQAL